MRKLKRQFLKWLYFSNKEEFYSFFIEEMLGEIPKDIQEPAISFLWSGRDRMEKWLLYHAYVLQRRIKDNPKEIDFISGMLVYLKLLLLHVYQTRKPVLTVRGTKKEETINPLERVEEFVEKMLKKVRGEDKEEEVINS